MRTLQCQHCTGMFETSVTDEEIEQDYVKRFGVSSNPRQTIFLCAPCMEKFNEWRKFNELLASLRPRFSQNARFN